MIIFPYLVSELEENFTTVIFSYSFRFFFPSPKKRKLKTKCKNHHYCLIKIIFLGFCSFDFSTKFKPCIYLRTINSRPIGKFWKNIIKSNLQRLLIFFCWKKLKQNFRSILMWNSLTFITNHQWSQKQQQTKLWFSSSSLSPSSKSLCCSSMKAVE